MRNVLFLALAFTVGLSFVACKDSKESTQISQENKHVLRVGATPVPAAEILEFVKPMLAKEGINLQVQSFTDYVVPNVSLAEGSSDANMYQHKPYLEATNAQKGYHLVALEPVWIVPLGFYSTKHKNVESIPQNATIAIPGDSSNLARALILLHDNGLIKLKDGDDTTATEMDIIENPRKFYFKPMEAATLPFILDSVDAAVINANYALQAKMSIKDSFFHENNKSIYTNVLATNVGSEEDWRILALQKALLSKETKEFILSTYNGEILPVSEE